MSDDGRMVWSGNQLHAWEPNNLAHRIVELPEDIETESLESGAFSTDGSRLIVTSLAPSDEDGSGETTYVETRLWQTDTGQTEENRMTHDYSRLSKSTDGYRPYKSTFSPDGMRIASIGYDHKVRIWDGCTGKPVNEPIYNPKHHFSDVSFSPDGNHIVTGSFSGALQIFDVSPVVGCSADNSRNVRSSAFQ